MLCFKIMQEITPCDAAEVSKELVITHTSPASAVEEKGNKDKESVQFTDPIWNASIIWMFLRAMRNPIPAK